MFSPRLVLCQNFKTLVRQPLTTPRPVLLPASDLLRNHRHHLSGGFIRGNWSVKMPGKVNNQRMITVSVDGNISSGKSTLVANLKELFSNKFNFHVELVPEPLEKWTNLKGHNLLGMLYEDLTKNNFMFQHYVQLTRLMDAVKKAESDSDACGNGTVRVLERSLQNNRYCFTELARREGSLSPEEYAVLSEWHSWLDKQFDISLEAIIYLRTDPEVVYNRMQKRGRSEESTVPKAYLTSLHETYENWLIRGKIDTTTSSSLVDHDVTESELPKKLRKQKVIVIDGNQGIEQVAMECKSRLAAFMKELGYDEYDDVQNCTESDTGEKSNNNKCNGNENNALMP